MQKGEVAAKAPIRVEVEEGKSYFWCVCGKSQKQPFCDGSHKGSDFAPLKWTADASGAKPAVRARQSTAIPVRERGPAKLAVRDMNFLQFDAAMKSGSSSGEPSPGKT